jgi:hypothetical protein
MKRKNESFSVSSNSARIIEMCKIFEVAWNLEIKDFIKDIVRKRRTPLGES